MKLLNIIEQINLLNRLMKQFNVIHFDFTHKKVVHYDVLPYFREEWKDKYHKEEKNKIKETKSKKLLRQ